MSRLALSAALWLGLTWPSLAAGWHTIVDDSQGFRTAALRGESADDAERGISVMCAPGGDSMLAVAAAPSEDFSALPGDRVEIAANGSVVAAGELRRNDSSAVVVWGDVENLSALLGALVPQGDEMMISIAGVAGAQVTIPMTGFSDSLKKFLQACRVQ